MDVHRVVGVARVAAGHAEGDRQRSLAAESEHESVAGGKPGLGEFQAPEAVVLERVGASKINREIGLGASEGFVQPFPQCGQVL